MYVPVLVVLDMDDECLSSYGSRRGFFFGVSVQGGAGEFEKEKSKRPIHTVELREIYIQAPKEGNLQSGGGARRNAPLCTVVPVVRNGNIPNLESWTDSNRLNG